MGPRERCDRAAVGDGEVVMEEDTMTFADYEERARFAKNCAPEGINLRYGALSLAGDSVAREHALCPPSRR
jgi:hypothetical protein